MQILVSGDNDPQEIFEWLRLNDPKVIYQHSNGEIYALPSRSWMFYGYDKNAYKIVFEITDDNLAVLFKLRYG